jgi:hypothetical protein
MHLSVWLFIGAVLVLPWLVGMIRQMDPKAYNVDPMNKSSIQFWLFILGISIIAFGIGISVSGQ